MERSEIGAPSTGNIKVGKIRNRSTKAGGKCKNGAETAKNFTTWEVSTTLLLTCSSSIFSKDGEFLFSDENIFGVYFCARRTAWYENKKKKYENTKICVAANIVRTVQNPSNLRSRENFHSLDQQNLKEVKQNNQSTDFSCSSWRLKFVNKGGRNISLCERSISNPIFCRFC